MGDRAEHWRGMASETLDRIDRTSRLRGGYDGLRDDAEIAGELAEAEQESADRTAERAEPRSG